MSKVANLACVVGIVFLLFCIYGITKIGGSPDAPVKESQSSYDVNMTGTLSIYDADGVYYMSDGANDFTKVGSLKDLNEELEAYAE